MNFFIKVIDKSLGGRCIINCFFDYVEGGTGMLPR